MTIPDLAIEKPTVAKSPRRKVILFVAALIIVFSFLIEDVVGWINGGGIFSITSALQAANVKMLAIDIDSAGLRSPIIDMLCLAVLGTCYWLDIDVRKRAVSLVVILAIIGGAFILDGIYGESIITSLMASHGYTRCPDLDHHVGNGKSKVWLNRYELRAVDCPAASPRQ